MESISNKTGKKFTGKFASTAVRLGLATPSGESKEVKPKAESLKEKDNFDKMPPEWKKRNIPEVKEAKKAPKKVQKKTKK